MSTRGDTRITVYLLIGVDGRPFYIGASTDIEARLAKHRRDRGRYEQLRMLTKWQATQRVELVDCPSRREMKETERRLIEKYRPVLNKLDNPDYVYHPVRVDEWVKQQLNNAPPLTDDQRDRLADLLRPVREARRARAMREAKGKCQSA